ncbi:MAG: hypothetical protein WCA37_01260 [Terracidiphilus sp.]
MSNGLLQRLPITFQPFVHQQLREWDNLFPAERRSVQRLLRYVASLTPAQSTAAFAAVLQLEDKMGVRTWQFSTSEQTILNASLLARSPYYQQWRQAVQAVFNVADDYAIKTDAGAAATRRRLVLLNIPSRLPIQKAGAWDRWQGIGAVQPVELPGTARASGSLAYLLYGEKETGPSLLHAIQHNDSSPAQAWVIDAGDSLTRAALEHQAATPANPAPTLLGYKRLEAYRQNFSQQMNTMRKDLVDADAVYDRLRSVDVRPWCPPEAASPSVREFIRALFLSGNGAVIFGNSFVEWGAAEALRRARPALLAAQFDVRPKPKPFTGVAVFDNPDQVNPLPSVEDPQGSALDAQLLSLYIWLAALRYDEYQHSTVCICLADSIAEAYVIAPPEFSLPHTAQPIPLATLRDQLSAWLA